MTNSQVLFRVLVIIFIVEGIVMLALSAAPPIENHFVEAGLDALFLSALSAAPIMLWVVKPYSAAKNREIKVEAARLEEAFQESINALAQQIENSELGDATHNAGQFAEIKSPDTIKYI